MLDITELGIQGSFLIQTPTHGDDRGFFREWFKAEELEKSTNKKFPIAQANLSRSKKGVVRGIHFSTAPLGQAKWVTCASGSIWDVVIDIRPDSPTYKSWIAQELRAEKGNSVFIGEGLGHAFVALEDDSVISYLLSTPYAPEFELAINPLDPEIGIDWPISPLQLSARDQSAPGISELFG